jgi:hypothetical protein
LLNEDSLNELDDLLDIEWERLTTIEDDWIKHSAAEQMRVYSWRTLEAKEQEQEYEKYLAEARERATNRRARAVALTLTSGHKLVVERFNEAARHPELAQRHATAFTLTFKRADISVELELSPGWKDFSLKCTPDDREATRDVFGAIYNWSRKYAPARWQRWWSASPPLPLMLLMFYTVICSFILASAYSGTSKDALRSEAYRLLRSGITASNQTRAIELVLALTSDYPLRVQPTGMTPRAWFVVVAGFIIFLALNIVPRSVIGIGLPGRRRFRFWTGWLRFAAFTFPAAIFANFVWPYIQSLATRVF